MERYVIKLGDGQNICSECWKKEFEKPEPTYGWFFGKCDFCEGGKQGEHNEMF